MPLCVICGDKLANEAMVHSKLTLKHNHLANKPRSYFEGLLSEQKQQSAMLSKKVKVADKAQEASYLVVELVVKSMKPHTIAETLILPAISAIVKTMFESEAEKEVRKIPISESTISRRIHDMSADIEETVCTSVKESEMFALQVDESTDIGGMAQLLVFVRYIHDVKIVNQFFCCKELKETTTGNDIFSTLSEYLKSVGLTWQSCVGICTDSAPAMIGSIKGFVSLVNRENSSVITTHCFPHREVLVAKTISNDLKSVLEKVVKRVNFIKSQPLKSHLFTKLCEELEAKHLNLLLCTEAQWLSRGKVLSRVCELKEEILTIFTLEQQEVFSDLRADDTWCAKLSYLADIFELSNKVNASMLGKSEKVLSSTDKIKELKEKLQLWGGKVKEGNLDMFSHVAVAANSGEIIPIISEHLAVLENQLQHYFPGICTENYNWIRNPFVASISTQSQLTLMEEEQLVELRHDRDLKLLHKQLPLDKFWVQIKTKYPHVAKKALVMLIQFSTSYQ
ncbi:SCAN domain-containing protein 3-like, partial [Palaemon carinicauda]|uniref:SCAN domain-containing protein 3-like n=1 Tax=Palaemon carinicauda TaxID=392227 RepID=UPI0035B5A9AE